MSRSKSATPASRASDKAFNHALGLADEVGEFVDVHTRLIAPNASDSIVESVERNESPSNSRTRAAKRDVHKRSTDSKAPTKPRKTAKDSSRKTGGRHSPAHQDGNSVSSGTHSKYFKTPPTGITPVNSVSPEDHPEDFQTPPTERSPATSASLPASRITRETPAAQGKNRTWPPGKSVRFANATSAKASRVLKSPATPTRRSTRIRKSPEPFTGEVRFWRPSKKPYKKVTDRTPTPMPPLPKMREQKSKITDSNYKTNEGEPILTPPPTLPKKRGRKPKVTNSTYTPNDNEAITTPPPTQSKKRGNKPKVTDSTETPNKNEHILTPPPTKPKKPSKNPKVTDTAYIPNEDEWSSTPSPTLPKNRKRIAPDDPNASFKSGPDAESPTSSTGPRKSRRRTTASSPATDATGVAQNGQKRGSKSKTPAAGTKTFKAGTSNAETQVPRKRGRPRKALPSSKIGPSPGNDEAVNEADSSGTTNGETANTKTHETTQTEEAQKQQTRLCDSPDSVPSASRKVHESVFRVIAPPSELGPEQRLSRLPASVVKSLKRQSKILQVSDGGLVAPTSHPEVTPVGGSTKLAEDMERENIFDKHYRETGKELRINLDGLDKATKAMLIKHSNMRHQKLKRQGKCNRFERSGTPSPEPGLARKSGRRPAEEE
ncbi:MAG: hypothetical protein M1831_002703 [Alyxoria varia]|nr:MAG: hypothetical protein M1831_002703 [Alyxoria varia]